MLDSSDRNIQLRLTGTWVTLVGALRNKAEASTSECSLPILPKCLTLKMALA
jgi:hypothetical protein